MAIQRRRGSSGDRRVQADHDVFYSQEELEQILSETLSSAIDQIFKDEELKMRLQ
jgi:truncated hemoglobin YjbI